MIRGEKAERVCQRRGRQGEERIERGRREIREVQKSVAQGEVGKKRQKKDE